MKKRGLWLGLLIAAVLVGCRGQGDDLDDVTVDLAVTPDPPCAGPATVVVTLSDAGGQPISGAEMTLEGNMNHAGMVPVFADAFEREIETAPGRYEAALEFTMGGDWFILVQAKLPDGDTLERHVDLPGVDASCGSSGP